MHAHKMHSCKVYAYKICGHEMHACEIYAYEVYDCKGIYISLILLGGKSWIRAPIFNEMLP